MTTLCFWAARTALSIYAFWVLMKEETIQMLKGKAQA
jgi:hypothetical protein